MESRMAPVAWSWIVFVCCCVFVAGCDPGPGPSGTDVSTRPAGEHLDAQDGKDPAAEQIFQFGFDLRRSPQEDARQYLPFLAYLERATGYHIKLRFTPADSSIVDDLGQGKVQLAAVGAGTFLRANARYAVIPLVLGLNSEGKAEYQSVIVTRPDSPIRGVSDLKRRRFAFGSATSTQGHLIPRIVLMQHGIELDDLAGHDFTGSHLKTADAVLSGRFDAGGVQDTLGRELAAAGRLRIIDTSDPYPSSGIAANKDLAPEVIAKLRRALLDFRPKGRDASDLYEWDKTEMPNGFTAARGEDYTGLRDWARQLGYLALPD